MLTNAYGIINPQFYDGLAPELQQAVSDAGDEATIWLRTRTQQDEKQTYDF